MWHFLMIFLVLISTQLPSALPARSQSNQSRFGTFLDALQVDLLKNRNVELNKDFRYRDPAGKIWLAPRGWIVDGASIPKPLWSILGGPLDGNYRRAAAVHDVFCDTMEENWSSTHKMFYWAMRADDVSDAKALTMFAGVLAQGPRWHEDKFQTIKRMRPECDVESCRQVEKEVREKIFFYPKPWSSNDRAEFNRAMLEILKSPNRNLLDVERQLNRLYNKNFPIELWGPE
jgi:hypothetical protein